MATINVKLDVVMQYAFGWSNHRLQAPDFDPSFHDALLAGGEAGHVLKHFPLMLKFMRSLPDSLVAKLSPMMGLYARLQTVREGLTQLFPMSSADM